MVLSKAEKRRLKKKYLIDNLINKKHPNTFRKYEDDLKEARRRLPYSFFPENRAYTDIKHSEPTGKIYHIANKGIRPFDYDNEQERLAWEMINRRFKAIAGNIASRYDPKHIERFRNERFLSFPEEIKYIRRTSDLENIAKLKEKLPKASVVLIGL